MKKVLMLVMVLCSALAGVAFAGDGELLYQRYEGIAGGGINDLINNAIYPNSPTAGGMVTGLDVDEPSLDYYGGQVTGFIVPSQSDYYTFWIASDDDGEMWLAPSDQPGDAVKVANLYGWTGRYNYDDASHAGHQSAPIPLAMGQKYYVMMRWADGTGGGYSSVAWRGSPGSTIGTRTEVKAPYVTTIGGVNWMAVKTAPANGTTGIPVTGTTLTWDAPASSPQPIARYNVYASADPLEAIDPNQGTASPAFIGTVNTGNPLQIATGDVPSDSTIYWRVDTVISDANTAVGYAWSFQTELRKPVFSTQPQTLLVGEGGWDGQLTAAAASPQGEAVTIAWYKEGNATSIGSGDTLSITAINDAKSGNYYCVATNIFGDTTSNVVGVSVLKYGDLQLLGLEAYWPMDNGYSDMSGKGHHAVKGHTWTVADIVSDAVVGKAVSFGGTWGHALQAGTWNPSAVTGKLSVSHWVKWRGGGDTWQGTIGKRLTWNGTSTMWQFELTINNSPGYSDWKREGSYPGGGFDMPINQWTLVTITCDGSTAITYRDGVENGRGGFTFGPMTNAPVWIGACDGELLNGGGNPWNGLEDEVAIWDRVLTPAEVAQLYNGGNGLPLGGYWTVPSPISPDGSSLVNPDVDLSLVWNYGPYAPKGATYKVILSKDAAVAANPATPASYTVVNVNSATVPASVLNTDEKWYWRVDTVYNSRTESSGVFSFETIKTFPVPVTQPADVLVGQGETANYSFVVNSDSTVTYRWYKEAGAVDTLRSTKVGDNTFAVAGVTPASEGYYYCIATNAAGPTQSNNARLWMKQLIAYWPMDAIQPANPVDPNDRPKVLDVVGGHTGIVNGGAGPTVVAGRQGSAVQFDGGNDYVAVGAVGIYNQMPRTISVWVKSTFAQAPTDFINVFGFTSTPDGWCDGSFDINANIFNNQQYGLHTYCWERALAPTDTEWRNFVGTYDGSTIAWYTDGEPVGTDTRVLWTQDNVQMAHRGHDGKYFPGAIDEARIYNYALSPVQVARLYYDVTGEAACSQYPAVDYNRDCKVTLADFAIFVENWGQCNIVPDCLP